MPKNAALVAAVAEAGDYVIASTGSHRYELLARIDDALVVRDSE